VLGVADVIGLVSVTALLELAGNKALAQVAKDKVRLLSVPASTP